jgi:hypothetical protein
MFSMGYVIISTNMPERNSLFSPPVDQEMHGNAHNTFIESSSLGNLVSREGMAGLIKASKGGRVEFVGKSNIAEALDSESSYKIKGFVGWALRIDTLNRQALANQRRKV